MTVRKVEVADATESLATYVSKAEEGAVVVTEAGRPVAALVLLESTDLETVSLSTDRAFLDLIQTSRARQAKEGGMSTAEIRKLLKEPARG